MIDDQLIGMRSAEISATIAYLINRANFYMARYSKQNKIFDLVRVKKYITLSDIFIRECFRVHEIDVKRMAWYQLVEYLPPEDIDIISALCDAEFIKADKLIHKQLADKYRGAYWSNECELR